MCYRQEKGSRAKEFSRGSQQTSAGEREKEKEGSEAKETITDTDNKPCVYVSRCCPSLTQP